MKKLVAVLAALAFSAAAAAQTYKWVDKDGKVRYGDTPPPGAKATPLKPPPGPSAPPPAPSAAKKDAKGKPLTPEQAFRKRQEERTEAEQKSAQERAEADKKRQNCDLAQANVRQIESGQRMTTTNAAGERVFIDDDQRAQQLARARQSAAEWCK
ncbi:MAG TPA: DUF4124 domain-containing protein [Burkholderiales bacterium]